MDEASTSTKMPPADEQDGDDEASTSSDDFSPNSEISADSPASSRSSTSDSSSAPSVDSRRSRTASTSSTESEESVGVRISRWLLSAVFTRGQLRDGIPDSEDEERERVARRVERPKEDGSEPSTDEEDLVEVPNEFASHVAETLVGTTGVTMEKEEQHRFNPFDIRSFFHETIERLEAEERLQAQKPGTFLLRSSASKFGNLVLSVRMRPKQESTVRHYLIEKKVDAKNKPIYTMNERSYRHLGTILGYFSVFPLGTGRQRTLLKQPLRLPAVRKVVCCHSCKGEEREDLPVTVGEPVEIVGYGEEEWLLARNVFGGLGYVRESDVESIPADDYEKAAAVNAGVAEAEDTPAPVEAAEAVEPAEDQPPAAPPKEPEEAEAVAAHEDELPQLELDEDFDLYGLGRLFGEEESSPSTTFPLKQYTALFKSEKQLEEERQALLKELWETRAVSLAPVRSVRPAKKPTGDPKKPAADRTKKEAVRSSEKNRRSKKGDCRWKQKDGRRRWKTRREDVFLSTTTDSDEEAELNMKALEGRFDIEAEMRLWARNASRGDRDEEAKPLEPEEKFSLDAEDVEMEPIERTPTPKPEIFVPTGRPTVSSYKWTKRPDVEAKEDEEQEKEVDEPKGADDDEDAISWSRWSEERLGDIFEEAARPIFGPDMTREEIYADLAREPPRKPTPPPLPTYADRLRQRRLRIECKLPSGWFLLFDPDRRSMSRDSDWSSDGEGRSRRASESSGPQMGDWLDEFLGSCDAEGREVTFEALQEFGVGFMERWNANKKKKREDEEQLVNNDEE